MRAVPWLVLALAQAWFAGRHIENRRYSDAGLSIGVAVLDFIMFGLTVGRVI